MSVGKCRTNIAHRLVQTFGLCYNVHYSEETVKLIAQVKLQPTEDQFNLLKATLEQANDACNFISEYAWEHKTFGKFSIQKAIYHEIRERFGLSAQMTIRAIAKVTDSYRVSKKTKRTFKPLGSIAYDDRILSWKLDKQEVSILSLGGRLKMPFLAGQHQLDLLQNRQGETDLVYRRGNFYLLAVCNVEEPPAEVVDKFLGIDLGIVNVAVDSEGNTYSGTHLNNIRARYTNLRAKLQSIGTKSAKRLLVKRNRKESNFAKTLNHTIARRIVDRAKTLGLGIALEDLSGIRQRVTVKKAQRRVHHSWSFYDLRTKILYKAKLTGVPVILVDPRNTSRECSKCGHIAKSNRKSQAEFLCRSCGFALNADLNAARVIAGRGVSSAQTERVLQQTSSPLMSAVGST